MQAPLMPTMSVGRGQAGFSPPIQRASTCPRGAQYHDSRAIAPGTGGCKMGTEAEHNRLPRCLKV
jgi:hypothetical protein